MTAELGLFFLILALMVSALQACYLLPRLRPCIVMCLIPAAWLQALCITLSFALLITLRLDSDFSVINVIQHSNLTLPTLYKIAGTWGNHEGSMLLWVLVLAAFGATLAMQSSPWNTELRRLAVAVQAALCTGFLTFILLTSNPFARRFPPTADGEALNPILQDMALAMHPPLLYLGYVGFSMVFSLAVAAMLNRQMGRDWADVAHPWILASWSALTVGIGLGSWWAYRVLGWGGFWFWDPVENASLLPWLAGTALLHSNLVLKNRGALAQWVLLLSIITFGLSLLGTFLVRSGVLISVHSFASDPTRGFFILCYIIFVLGSALWLFATRAGDLQSTITAKAASREGVIVLNNVFLLSACATVLLGTTYPLMMEWISGDKISVGPPYYNATFLPLMALPLFFAGIAPFMPWKNASLADALKQAKPSLYATLAALILTAAIVRSHVVLAFFGFALAAWLGASSIQWIRSTNAKHSLSVFLGHMGAALLIAGLTGASLFKQDVEKSLRVGESFDIAGYTISYDKESEADTADYQSHRAEFSIRRGKNPIATLAPEYRLFGIRKTATSVADIHARFLSDIYVVIGETTPDYKTAVRAYYNPMIYFIWGGCIVMTLGGIAALTRRLYAK